MPPPLFHAELLPHIRTITLSVTLPTPATPSTTLTQRTPTTLALHHDGTHTPLPLPAASGPTSQLSVAPGATQLSYRLPVAPQHQRDPDDNHVPWSAAALAQARAGRAAALLCAACAACVVLDGARVRAWKDLPSGNWAEMMEFWHCHKPAAPEGAGGSEAARGAEGGGRCGGFQEGAGRGGYSARPGTVLVDLTCFVVAQSDCEGVQVVETPHGPNVYCANCKSHLGAAAPRTHSYTLNKWKLKLCLSSHGIREEYSYPLEPFLAAQLLALAEGEGIRRMLISPAAPAGPGPDASGGGAQKERKLKLWLFSADVRYTSSAVDRPLRAIKVFYQDDDGDGDQQQGQGTSLGSGGFEEVALQREMVVGLRERLQQGAGAGGAAVAAGFGPWRVGYLMRFEGENRGVGG